MSGKIEFVINHVLFGKKMWLHRSNWTKKKSIENRNHRLPTLIESSIKIPNLPCRLRMATMHGRRPIPAHSGHPRRSRRWRKYHLRWPCFPRRRFNSSPSDSRQTIGVRQLRRRRAPKNRIRSVAFRWFCVAIRTGWRASRRRHRNRRHRRRWKVVLRPCTLRRHTNTGQGKFKYRKCSSCIHVVIHSYAFTQLKEWTKTICCEATLWAQTA